MERLEVAVAFSYFLISILAAILVILLVNSRR